MDNRNLFGAYLENILEQPQAVRDTVAGPVDLGLRPFAARIANSETQSIILTGMGASYHALQPLVLTLVASGVNAQRIETSELEYHAPRLLHSRALVIAVSQSGQSIEIVKLLDRKQKERFPLIGVTNTPGSPLAATADATVHTHAGSEYSVSTKTYVATLAALDLLGAFLINQELESRRAELVRAAAAMEQYLAHWSEHVVTLMERLKDVDHIVLAGRGPSLAAVGTGALIIREAARFPCQEMSSAAFRHGPMEIISPKLFALVFSGVPPTKGLNRGLVADIKSAGGQAELVEEDSGDSPGSIPAVPLATLPLLEILVPQMISLALARLRGHIPGQFVRTTKITMTE